MKTLSKNNRTGKLSVVEVPIPSLDDGFLMVKNVFSAISLGTERASVDIARKNLIEKAKSRPDDLKKVLNLIEKVGVLEAYKLSMDRLELPSPLGYSSSGIVVKTSPNVRKFKVGDRVATGGCGHSELISVSENLCVKLPDNVSFQEAAFTTIASISLQGIRQAEANLGDKILVIGLGLIGQITMKLLKSMGCKAVGIDIEQKNVDNTNELNFNAFTRDQADLQTILSNFTGGNGFDKVIITASTDSDDPIILATDSVMDRGRITILGDVPLNLSRNKFYDKELELNLSRSYGAGRYSKNYEEYGLDYPIEYVRWTENRNMETIVNLISDDNLTFKDFKIKTFNFNSSPKAYDFLQENDDFLTGLISYPKIDDIKINRTNVFSESKPTKDKIKIGFIGLGNYSQTVLMPLIVKNKNLILEGLFSRDGRNGTHLAKKYGFRYVTSDVNKLMQDKTIDIVFITSRHDTHAEYVIECFNNNKNVFVEKPLALEISDIKNITQAYEKSESTFMIGFNRRFSQLTENLKTILSNTTNSSIYIDYTVNADSLPKDHWLNDIRQGGGRLVGEGCHFLDFCQYVIGDKFVSHSIDFLSVDSSKPKDNSFILKTKYSNGSVSNIAYLPASTSLPKEVIQVSFDGGKLIIKDFKTLEYFGDSRLLQKIQIRQDKGQSRMIEEVVKSLFNNEPLINFNEVIRTSEALIEMRDSN